MIRFYSALVLVAALSLTANAQWSGSNGWSGSSGAQSNAAAQQPTVSNSTFELGTAKDKVMVQFPEGSIVRRMTGAGLAEVLVWAYDGKQFVCRSKPEAFDKLIHLYAGDEIPEGKAGEWTYHYADLGQSVMYVAMNTMGVYAAGVVDRGTIRNTDVYVRNTLTNIKVGMPAVAVATTQPTK
jgi:hypothetical protein